MEAASPSLKEAPMPPSLTPEAQIIAYLREHGLSRGVSMSELRAGTGIQGIHHFVNGMVYRREIHRMPFGYLRYMHPPIPPEPKDMGRKILGAPKR